jgi:hypothetical protein
MSHKNLVVQDPRTIDGDPYEVAGIATRQASGVGRVLAQAIDDAYAMARNAELSRQLDSGQEADEQEWYDSAQARAYRKLMDATEEIERRLEKLAIAAEFNPRAR